MPSDRTSDDAGHRSASVTVVVPTYNRQAFLSELIDSLKAQTYEDFRVTLVDDGSTDDTKTVARDAFDGDERFTLVSKQNEGPARARNVAGLAATTEWLAFTDDDCVPQPRWLEELLAEARRAQASVVQGRTLSDPSVDRRELPWFVRGKDVVAWSGRFQTCNLAVRTSAFKAVGGFDERFPFFGEDIDLGVRLIGEGARTSFASEGVVHHRLMIMSYPAYLKRRYQWSGVVYAVSLNPDTRSAFRFRYIGARTHAGFWIGVGVAAFGLATGRWWIAPAGVLTYALHRARATRWEGRSLAVRYTRALLQIVGIAVESIGFVIKSVRFRTLLL